MKIIGEAYCTHCHMPGSNVPLSFMGNPTSVWLEGPCEYCGETIKLDKKEIEALYVFIYQFHKMLRKHLC